MKHATKTKYYSDIDLHERAGEAKKPFRVQRENNRRFIRLEISSPVALKKVKDGLGHFFASGGPYTIDGTILNISAGGVLIETEQLFAEGEIVQLRFTLQGHEIVDNILGLVKRSEHLDDLAISGIEFITRDQLTDRLSQGEMEMLPAELCDFHARIQEVLKRHISHEHQREAAE